MTRSVIVPLLLSSLLVTTAAQAQGDGAPPPKESAPDTPDTPAPTEDAEAPRPPSDDEPDDRAAARTLGSQALKLYQQGRFAEAYERFEMANRLLKAPTLLLFMARCQREQGQWVAADATFQRVIDTPIQAGAPPQFREAADNAKQEQAELEPKIPTLKVSLTGKSATGAQLFIDDRAIAPGALKQPIKLDPGEHVVRATAPGIEPQSKTVTLQAGGTTTSITMALGDGAAPGPDDGATSGPPIWPAAVGYGVGGAGLLLGTITGVLAMNKIDDVRSRCVDNRCLPEDAPLADDAQMLADISTAGFVVGGVGLAAGVALTIWATTGSSEEQAAGGDTPSGDTPSGPSAQLLLRPGSVMLKGTF